MCKIRAKDEKLLQIQLTKAICSFSNENKVKIFYIFYYVHSMKQYNVKELKVTDCCKAVRVSQCYARIRKYNNQEDSLKHDRNA